MERNYFDVTPKRGERIDWTRKKPRKEDFLDGVDNQWMQGELLAQETLMLAGQNREAESAALTLIFARAHEIAMDAKHQTYFVAIAFIDAVLRFAVDGVKGTCQ